MPFQNVFLYRQHINEINKTGFSFEEYAHPNLMKTSSYVLFLAATFSYLERCVHVCVHVPVCVCVCREAWGNLVEFITVISYFEQG